MAETICQSGDKLARQVRLDGKGARVDAIENDIIAKSKMGQ
jgi:hypothetical protein